MTTIALLVLHTGELKRVEKGHDTVMTSPTDKKKICVHLFFMLIPFIKFEDPISNCS